MSLMKWFRKNNKKIMAIVVIILLIGFLGGSYFSRLAQRSSSIRQTVATFADGIKITNYDIALAQQELEILKMLRVDMMLKSSIENLHLFILGELLFPERTISPLMLNRVRQNIQNNGLRITDKQLSDIYRTGISRDLLWLLLTSEAEQAGIKTLNERMSVQLARLIPQLFNNVTYPQIIQSIMQQTGVSEERIVETFGKIFTVIIYAEGVCANENFTSNQISQLASYQQEMINSELVRFSADLFVADNNDFPQDDLVEHFEKYKSFYPGQISTDNPFGFGYELPDMARLEYIVVKIDDISGIVSEPEPEEIEEYFQRYRQQYTTSVPSDPNDPNSPMIQKQRSFAEVANLIADQLLQRNINAKADEIIQQAKTFTEASLEKAGIDTLTASTEQIKEHAGDYEKAALELSEQYKIPIYAGQTGLLSASEMMRDRYLGMMSLSGQSLNLIRLTQVVFAIDELQGDEIGLLDIVKPKIYQNIGPTQDFTGQIVALLRVIEAQKAVEPDSIELEFSKSAIQLEQQEDVVYSVKEKIIEDVKKITAFDVAKIRAGRFKDSLISKGWDEALVELNKVYKQEKGLPETDPNVFAIERLSNLRRIPDSVIEILKVQAEGSPESRLLIEAQKKQKLFIDNLYDLVPPEEDSLKAVPALMQSRSDMSWYVIRSVSINRFYQEDFQISKAQGSYQQDFLESQNMAVVHFNPDNILKRMNFSVLRRPGQIEDANTPGKSSGRT
ncbi:MAG: hypothetical protein ACYSYW_05510 [Planctomycetota bacterium]|jgi:hypothetical protein